MELSQKQKTLSQYFSAFLKCSLNFEHFQKKMTLIAGVFLKLRTPKNMARSMRKKSGFRESVEKPHGKCQQTLFKFDGQPLYDISRSLGSQLLYKKSMLGIVNMSKFPKTWLHQCEKDLVSEDPLKSNMVNAPTLCSNLKDTSFTIFINN